MTGYRYRCSLDSAASCSRGTTYPRYPRCRHCAAALVIESGLWGVFRWRTDGRYQRDDALRTFGRRGDAERLAGGNLVVRFIPDEKSYPVG